MIQLEDRVRVSGHLTVTARYWGGLEIIWYDGHNDLTDLAQQILTEMWARDINAFPTRVEVGSGGDFDGPVSGGGSDTGIRQAPIGTETEIRKRDASIEIVATSVEGGSAVFEATAKPRDFVASGLNEYALFTRDGRMLSHVVTPAALAGGQAQTRDKTALHYLIIRWKMTPTVTAVAQASP